MSDSNQNNKNNSKNNTRSNAKRRNNNRRKNVSRNRRPKSLSPSRVLQKYDNLLEQHLIARKKYFEMHARVGGKQLEKIQNNLMRTLEELRRFESSSKEWQQEVLKQKINPYPEDNQYSSEHELPPVDYVDFVGNYEDPHLLPTQKSQDWSQDTEESQGTMDDYYNYKGIDAPVPVNESDSDKVR
jgi:hypothetical protein